MPFRVLTERFRVLTEREEKNSVAIASNEFFGGRTKTFGRASRLPAALAIEVVDQLRLAATQSVTLVCGEGGQCVDEDTCSRNVDHRT